MKFQLFGRLRGDDDSGNGGSAGNNNGPASRDTNSRSTDSGLGGGGLERTVENMFSQGYSQDEIKQELQGQYSPNRIEQAVNEAVASSAKRGASGPPPGASGPEPMTPYQGEKDAVSPVDEGFDGENDVPGPGPQQQQPQQPPPGEAPQQGGPEPVDQQEPLAPQQPVDPSVEELIETVVAENFDLVEEEFQHVYSEIDGMKQQLEELEERVHDLEVRDDEDQEQFIQKMDEMEEHIDNYQSRIGGLEKAFQQVLPSLVDNVRDLTDLVQEIKQERGIDTEKNVSSDEIEGLDMDDWD